MIHFPSLSVALFSLAAIGVSSGARRDYSIPMLDLNRANVLFTTVDQTPSLRSRNRPLASALAKGAKSNFLAIIRQKAASSLTLQQCRAISASRRGPALRPKPASNRTLVIRRRQVEAYPNLMSDAMCKLRQDRIEF